MKPLPVTYATSLLRLDFQDEQVWERVRDAVLAPHTADESHLAVIDDEDFAGLDEVALRAAAPDAYEEALLIVFDKHTREHPDNPLLFIDWRAFSDEDDDERFTPGSLRVAPDQVQTVETNLSLRNMDFEDLQRHADSEGIFRGFP